MRAGGRELDNPNTYSQTIKFDRLIEYTMKNIFLKKLIHNVLEKLVPDLFLKNENQRVKGLKFYTTCLYVHVEEYQLILKLRC